MDTTLFLLRMELRFSFGHVKDAVPGIMAENFKKI